MKTSQCSPWSLTRGLTHWQGKVEHRQCSDTLTFSSLWFKPSSCVDHRYRHALSPRCVTGGVLQFLLIVLLRCEAYTALSDFHIPAPRQGCELITQSSEWEESGGESPVLLHARKNWSGGGKGTEQRENCLLLPALHLWRRAYFSIINSPQLHNWSIWIDEDDVYRPAPGRSMKHWSGLRTFSTSWEGKDVVCVSIV